MLALDTGGSVGVGLETLVESGGGSLGSALGSVVVEDEPGDTFRTGVGGEVVVLLAFVDQISSSSGLVVGDDDGGGVGSGSI